MYIVHDKEKMKVKLIISFFIIPNFGSLGIVPTFLKLDSWSLGVGFIPITSTTGINQMKKGKL